MSERHPWWWAMGLTKKQGEAIDAICKQRLMAGLPADPVALANALMRPPMENLKVQLRKDE